MQAVGEAGVIVVLFNQPPPQLLEMISMGEGEEQGEQQQLLEEEQGMAILTLASGERET